MQKTDKHDRFFPKFVPVAFVMFCLFLLGFYGPVNNKVMSSRSVNSGTVPGQAKTF